MANNCTGKLKTKEAGGIGFSLYRISTVVSIDCESDCEFKVKDTIRLEIITLVFVTITQIRMKLCEEKVSWTLGLGLGLGWNGATWEVDQV
ncbi:hypothetical protein AB9P05_14180 [Roseivirga sp. BDSF3-8]|uniref:hypothetical protein n=1 Tax=Roseivirga sp. BDSF3-8 TaxID=3241598 RepID=UPI0035325C07